MFSSLPLTKLNQLRMSEKESYTRDDHVYMAKLAEQAERYEDMVSSMKEVSYVT